MQESNINQLLNWGISENYTKDYKDLIVDFFTLHEASSQLQEFLKCKMDKKTRFYYQGFLHSRASDHFSNAILLLSQGHVIDAYTLSRSALEVLLLIINFDINPAFFNLWFQDGKKFKIKPAELRENIKNDPRFSSSYDFFNGTYKKLSEWLHPTKGSGDLYIRTMVDHVDSDTTRYKFHTIILLASYAAYLKLFILMLNHRSNSKEDIKKIASVEEIVNTIDINKWNNSVN